MSNRVSSIISDQTLSRIIQIESGGRPKAKAPTSSATGLGQFLNATWLGTVRRHRPDWLQDRTQAQVLAMRLDPVASIEMLARFTEDNAASLGSGWTDADIYLAHFSGVGVARKLLRAPAGDPASRYYSQAAIAANRSILYGKTVGQVRAWAARKMAAAGRTNWIARYWTGSDAPKAALLAADAEIADDAVVVRVEDEEANRDAGMPTMPAASPGEVEITAPQASTTSVASVEVEVIQRRLKTLGYHEVGIVDSKIDSRLVGAIAAFKMDRNIQPPVGEIDDALRVELTRAEAETNWRRPIGVERATASPDTVARQAPEVVPVKQTRLAAFWGAIVAAVTAAVNFVSDRFQEALSWLVQVKDFLNLIPGWVWLLSIAAGLVVIYFKSQSGVQGITDAVREGKRN